jgi:wobble nucleotide-excising tRNase
VTASPIRHRGRQGWDTTSNTEATSQLSGGTDRESFLQTRTAEVKRQIDDLDEKGKYLKGEARASYERKVEEARDLQVKLDLALDDLQNRSAQTEGQ